MKENWKWYACPKCGYGHFMKVRPDTKIINYPAYCKICKNEIIVTLEPESQNSYSKAN